MQTKKIAVLFSGNGSNLESILEHVHNKIYSGVKFEVVLTISNKADAYGIVRAAKYGLKSVVIENKVYKSREEFDVALVAEIKKYDVDLVVLAGFMRILTSVFTSAVKAINLHPSILPLFKGANAIKESYESDMQVGGVSVHWVSEELDGGKIIAQRTFERTENMSKEAWESRIHEIEHELLPQSIIKILSK
ncbi:phosphoribosylglycinamide formyltransferase [Campylobacter sp. faydin G-105]|uniref:phosphoribosylglycinamide formyltransferase n=1 Tax=Campylobacter anatolicus TaxID=2829105 RepID=UPI001B91B9F2|nr:phosphoribosylglycinamide formyltransferase [Campylobacter anatolicus]MBR8462294.1 phosphoribosylglycinamide formyltransferase [Campylobacter anatolicus]